MPHNLAKFMVNYFVLLRLVFLRGYPHFSGTPLGCQNVYQNFHRTIPLSHFKKKNPKNFDPPSLEKLLKAENLFFLFLPLKKNVFLHGMPGKKVSLLIRYALDPVSPGSLMSYRFRFFDIWTKKKSKGTEKGLQMNLGKTAKKAKIMHISCFFSLTMY